MDMMTKAKELGELIAGSEEMEGFRKYEAVISGDREALGLLDRYKGLQVEMVDAVRSDREKSLVDAIRQELLGMQEKIEENEGAREYMKAKAAVESLMKSVNDMIIFGITGEAPGCTGKDCNQCGGGCSGE